MKENNHEIKNVTYGYMLVIANTEAQKELDKFQELNKKANTGDVQAQYDLGMFYKAKAEALNAYQSKDREAYEEKQTEWLLKAAIQGNIDAQHALLALYKEKSSDGRSTDSDLTNKIETMLINIAQKGDAKDQYALAQFYMQSGYYSKQQKAGEWIKKAADQGLVEAEMDLGEGYLDGSNGIEKNYNKAKALFEKLVNEKHNAAYYYLAQCYQKGYGVAKDEKKAIELYEIAANDGSVYAAAILSEIYLTGIDGIISRDKEKFIQYYKQVYYKASRVEYNAFRQNIGKACIKINKGTDFLKENSTIDPLCKEVFIDIMRN